MSSVGRHQTRASPHGAQTHKQGDQASQNAKHNVSYGSADAALLSRLLAGDGAQVAEELDDGNHQTAKADAAEGVGECAPCTAARGMPGEVVDAKVPGAVYPRDDGVDRVLQPLADPVLSQRSAALLAQNAATERAYHGKRDEDHKSNDLVHISRRVFALGVTVSFFFFFTLPLLHDPFAHFGLFRDGSYVTYVAVRVTLNHALSATARSPPMNETRYTWPYFLLTRIVVFSISAAKGMRGIQEINATIVNLFFFPPVVSFFLFGLAYTHVQRSRGIGEGTCTDMPKMRKTMPADQYFLYR